MNPTLRRPPLQEIPLPVRSLGGFPPGSLVATMLPGQWSKLLLAAYRQGWLLVEMVNDRPCRAFQRQTTAAE